MASDAHLHLHLFHLTCVARANRQVGSWGGFILMTKANLGLGVLALPSVFGVLGLVPGIIIILVIQSMIACE
jgi:amino acid permease